MSNKAFAADRKKPRPLKSSVGLFAEELVSRIALALSVIVSLAAIGLVVVAIYVPKESIATETYKALLQLVVIGAVGHVVSLLVTKANNERQELLQLNELRKLLLDKLNDAFVQVKKIRRLARATSNKKVIDSNVEYFLSIDRFHTYMQSINEVQLELELVSKDIATYKDLFEKPEVLVANIDSMEQYLNRIVDEYEHSLVDECSDLPGEFPVKELATFSDLLGKYRSSKFRPEFVHRYYASLYGIRKDLANLKRKKKAQQG